MNRRRGADAAGHAPGVRLGLITQHDAFQQPDCGDQPFSFPVVEQGPDRVAQPCLPQPAAPIQGLVACCGKREERISQLAAGYPGGRLPEAEDIAHAVAFFADPATRFITGQVLIIDGGRSVGLSPS